MTTFTVPTREEVTPVNQVIFGELYLTNKAVKEIAYELGYDDEYYFSRFFKNNVDISPQVYRDTVGFGRAIA